MKRFGKLVAGLAASIALIATTAACGSSDDSSSSDPSGTTKISVAYSSPVPTITTAFLQAGIEQGYFEKRGIDVDIKYVSGSVLASSLLQSGQADVAIGGSEQMPAANEQGADQVAIYQYLYSPLFPVAFLEGSRVQDIADMEGAKVGVASAESGSIPLLQASLEKEGLSLSDVELIPIGVGPQAIQAVKAGSVDVLAYNIPGYVDMQSAGIDLTVSPDPAYAGKYPGQVIYTSGSTLDSKKDELTSFLKAATESLKFCTDSSEECVKAFAANTDAPADQEESLLSAWEALLLDTKLPTEADGIYGYTAEEYWKTLLDVQLTANLVTDPADPTSFFSTSLLKAANES